MLLLSLPYALVQPMLRYRYLVETLCLFLAFDGIHQALAWARAWWSSRTGVGRPAMETEAD
jgi:hypothetical protein